MFRESKIPFLLLNGIALVLLITFASVQTMEPLKVGGSGPVKDATGVNEIFELVRTIQPLYEAKMNLKSSHAEFTPTHYRTQLVAGMNYFVKVRIGPNQFVHLRIYKPFSGPSLLHGIQTSKTEADPLDYFDQNLD